MGASNTFPAEGACTCRQVRYRVETAPLFVHCCHCRWCQRESGASFALNAMIEADRVTELGEPPSSVTRSASIIALSAKEAPDSRWHQRQWQQWTKSGAVSTR